MGKAINLPEIDCAHCGTTLGIEDDYGLWDIEDLVETHDLQVRQGWGRNTIFCLNCYSNFMDLLEDFPELPVVALIRLLAVEEGPTEQTTQEELEKKTQEFMEVHRAYRIISKY